MSLSLMTIKDYDEIYNLWAATEGMGLRSLDDSREGIAAFLKRNPTTNFIYRLDDMVAGVIMCGHDGRRGYIYHAVVREDYRRRGIGKTLVNAALEALDKEGIKKAALVVFSDNDKGNDFWEAQGFTVRPDLTYRNKAIDLNNV